MNRYNDLETILKCIEEYKLERPETIQTTLGIRKNN